MVENTNNENAGIAQLSEGEPVVSAEYVEENKETIEKLVEEAKVEEVKLEETVVVEPEKADDKPALGAVANGVMGVTTSAAPKKPAAKKNNEAPKETVAIHSSRNVTWSGVGKVYFGYNVVTKEQAEKWLTRNHTRLATPEEVAKEYGN